MESWKSWTYPNTIGIGVQVIQHVLRFLISLKKTINVTLDLHLNDQILLLTTINIKFHYLFSDLFNLLELNLKRE